MSFCRSGIYSSVKQSTVVYIPFSSMYFSSSESLYFRSPGSSHHLQRTEFNGVCFDGKYFGRDFVFDSDLLSRVLIFDELSG